MARCRLLLLLTTMFVSCTCESDHAVIATSADERARLERDYQKELGCGGAGGHGFGIIFPVVDETTDQRLYLADGSSEKQYSVSPACACAEGEATLRVEEGGQRALVRCPGESEWDIYYLFGGGDSRCLPRELPGEPEWSDVPAFDGVAARFVKHRLHTRLVDDLRARHGSDAVAELLKSTVEIGGPGWDAGFDSLDEEARPPVLDALREALASDEPSHAAVVLGMRLLADERSLVIGAATRRFNARVPENRNDRRTRAAAGRKVLEAFSEPGAEDLKELTCALQEGHECLNGCERVYAETEFVCPGMASTLAFHVCDRSLCDEGSCTRDHLESLVATFDETPGKVRWKQVVLSKLAVARRPELAQKFATPVRRLHYDVVPAKMRCLDAPKGEVCRCMEDADIREQSCRRLDEKSFPLNLCEVVIDDEAQTLTTIASSDPRPPAGGDPAPSGGDR